MENKNSQERKNLFKTWLETLQQESWQLELLISGLALFGVFGAKTLIDDLQGFLDVQFFRATAKVAISIFMFLLNGSWYIFLINLVIHIILRGLWIGAIGLRYVSQDIDYDTLNFSSYFRKLYTRRYESFDDYIEDLERICSVIFAYTFLLFFILISACLFLLWPVVVLSLVGKTVGPIFLLVYLLLGLVVFIDFIAINPLKKVEDKWVSRIYGFIFRFYSTITLSFIFRPLLLNFLDNKFTKKLFLFSIPYGIVIIVILPQLTSQSLSYFPSFKKFDIEHRAYSSRSINPYLYDNLRPEGAGEIDYISLKEDRVEGSVFEFFVTHKRADERFFELEMEIEKINKIGVYTGFKSSTIRDSAYQVLSNSFTEESSTFLSKKKESKDQYSDLEWGQKFELLGQRQDSVKLQFFKSKAEQLNRSIELLNTYYIDGNEVTEQVDCLLSQHNNQDEKGWKCYLSLDTLENGIHYFTAYRGFYDSRNSIINPVKLEIPFILDRN